MGTLGLSPSGSNSKRPEASRRETNVVGVAIKRHARIEHKTQGRKQRRVVCKVTTLPKLGFCQRVLSDLSQAPVRELSFGHVSVEGFNVNLSESLGLTPWDPHACAEGSFRSVDLTTTSSPQLVGASVSFWPQRTPVISQKSTNHISTRSDQVASPVLVCVLCPTLWRQEAPRHTSAIAGSCPCLQHLVSSLSIPSLQHAGFVIRLVPCAVQLF